MGLAFFSLLALLFSLAFAAPQQAVRLPEKCKAEGLVVKAATGEPLNKARVVLGKAEGREQPYVTLTETGGRFTLKDIEPGRYRLWVERDGYVRQEYGQRSSNRPGSILSLEPGQQLRDITFRMLPSAVIAGRVFDEDREPLSRVSVQALRQTYVQGRRQLMPAGAATTNDLGEYRIWGLSPGRYFISATYSGGTTTTGFGALAIKREPSVEGVESYAPTYYPGTVDPSRASSLELRPGDEVPKADINLLRTHTVRIRGRVFNSISGQPARDSNVFLLPSDPGGRGWESFFRNQAKVEDTQGNFELRGVRSGAYVLGANWMDGVEAYFARLPVDVGNADIEGIQLALAPSINLAGRVRIEGEAGIRMTQLRVFLRPRDDISTLATNIDPVGADGTFVIQSVTEGTFNVDVIGAPQGFFLKSAQLGTENTLDSGLTIARGKPPATLELVLSPAGGRVEGIVLSDERLPVSGAQVVLVPNPDRRWRNDLYKTTTTDQFGRFTLTGLAPGEYKLFAWEEIETGAYQDPEFLRPYEKRGESLHVGEVGHASVQLKLIRAE